MILEELTLQNFCLYEGRQTLNLAPDRRRGKSSPIVLFGGINGGGKTTLLDAVQLVLYGNRARCSKRNGRPYDEFLKDSINRGVDLSDGAAITLSFRYASGGVESLYEVTRSWSVTNDRVRERVQVHRDGEPDGWLSENWSQLVEELIPYGVAQLCFFDAEQIRFLAEDDTSTQALGEAIKSLLGLDLVERLVADAAVLEGRVAKRSAKSDDLREVEQLETELDETQAGIDRLVQELGSLENPRQSAERRQQKAEEHFSKVGGRHWERRESRRRELVEIEQSVKSAEEQLTSLAATDLPFALVPDLLASAAQQAADERAATESSIVSALLSKRDENLLKSMRKKKASDKSVKIVQDFLQQDRDKRTSATDFPIRLRLSSQGESLLGHLLQRGLKERCTIARETLEKVENGRRRLEDLRREIAATPDEGAVKEVAEELKEASKELASLEQQIRRLEKQLEALRGDRSETRKRLGKLRRKVVDEEISNEEDARIGGLLVRTQQTMREFLRRATAAKIDQLSRYITESFQFLLRKQSLVRNVQIDPETFAITIQGNVGQTIPKERLSEGEKQIFAVSVLWGLSRASARPLPAIVDTPMARLDAKHRDQLVERYFPHASHQVVILSTDTEIERGYFQELQPWIARAYHLNYDEAQKSTVAEEGYFWAVEEESPLEEVAT